jgi:hypothetical protein
MVVLGDRSGEIQPGFPDQGADGAGKRAADPVEDKEFSIDPGIQLF